MRIRGLCGLLAFAAALRGAPARTLQPAAVSGDGRTRLFATNINPDGTVYDAANLFLEVEGVNGIAITQLSHIGAPGEPRTKDLPGITAVSVTPDGDAAASSFQPADGSAAELHVTNTTSKVDLKVATMPVILTPHISPDGKTVLFATNGAASAFSLAQADGSGVKALPVYSGSLAPSWQRVASTGGTVVFTSAAPFGPTFAAAAVNVYTMNADGTNIRQVTKFPNNPDTISRNATISADGSVIAFESNYGGGPFRIYTIRPDGFELFPRTDGSVDATSPSLSADGSLLLYTQSGALWQIVTASTHAPVPLFALGLSALQDPVVMDDGQSLVACAGPAAGTRGAIVWFDRSGVTRSLIYAPHVLFADGIVGAAGGAPSPGSLISVYGFNLGAVDELLQAYQLPLPLSLGILTLSVNGAPVPLLAVTPWQINAQLPPDLAPGPANFRVAYSGVITPPVTATVQPVAPGVFFRPGPDPRQAAALHAGTNVPADASRPAAAGETLEIYGTGFGAVTPPVAAGAAAPASPPAKTVNTVTATIGGRPATVTFAGLTPGLAGLYQINVVVPGGLAPGNQDVILQSAGARSDVTTIAVK